jgi:23S rRNA-/tRNA-specific pseudouridylate synthase
MFQTPEVYLLRKPAGIPTSRGKETCFLDLFAEGSVEMDRWIVDFPHFIEAFEQIRTMGGYELTNGWEARQWLLEEFSMREEYGLLNRLDTDTSGMVYFARSREVYEQRRNWQRHWKVQKWYLAQVEGDVRRDSLHASNTKETEWNEGNEGKVGTQFFASMDTDICDDSDVCKKSMQITFPIMHHKHDECMVSCINNDGMERMMRRGRGKVLEAESWVMPVSYDPETNTSIVRVMIHHGWRHQIRVHLATLGNPIIGDALYGKWNKGDVLQLVSCGCRVERK